MGNAKTTSNALRDAVAAQDRSYAWLSRATGIQYKRLLAEVKHARKPLTLDTTCAVADALGIDLLPLLEKEDAAA